MRRHPALPDDALDAVLRGEDTVRTAQYGGRGGMPSGPGAGGAMGNQGGRSGPSFNDFSADVFFDARLEQARRPAPIDPERNLEKRLEPRHARGEEDAIPYELDFDERRRLKLRQEIRRRERYLEDAENRMRENAPSFVQEHFKPAPEHLITTEERLEARRQRKDDATDRAFDPLPERVLPTRRHFAQVGQDDDIFSGTERLHTNGEGEASSTTGTVFDGGTTNPTERPEGGASQHVTPGPFPSDDANQTQNEVMQGLSDAAQQDADGFSNRSLAFDYPSEDERGDNGWNPHGTLPGVMDGMDGRIEEMLAGEPIEKQLGVGRQEELPAKQRLPGRVQDLQSTQGWRDPALRGPLRDEDGGEEESEMDWTGAPMRGGDPMGIGDVPLPRI